MSSIRLKGVDEFRRDLRRADKRLGKAFQKANKAISERVVAQAKPAVKALSSPGGTKAQKFITARGSQRKATVVLLGSRPKENTVRANVLGTRTHWVFGKPIGGSGPWKPWVGKSWTPEQLHGLGPVLKRAADGFILDDYLDAILDGLSEAFPD